MAGTNGSRYVMADGSSGPMLSESSRMSNATNPKATAPAIADRRKRAARSVAGEADGSRGSDRRKDARWNGRQLFGGDSYHAGNLAICPRGVLITPALQSCKFVRARLHLLYVRGFHLRDFFTGAGPAFSSARGGEGDGLMASRLVSPASVCCLNLAKGISGSMIG